MASTRLPKVAIGADTGIVFVLLPGATFTIGAQRNDKDGVNYDRAALGKEWPPHRVTLAPFFLARHELTQGQWRRLGGKRDQRVWKAGDTFPIADADWLTSAALLWSHGLTLPTKAQWEYGCRAGTTTPWWTGADEKSVAGELKAPLPVGSRRSNAFGLFDVHGNVWEWCADWYGAYSRPWRRGDGLRLADEGPASLRVSRGGGFGSGSRGARSSFRNNNAPTIRNNNLGARPAKTSLRPTWPSPANRHGGAVHRDAQARLRCRRA